MRRFEGGFTLMEVLTAASVAVVAASMGIPTMTDVIAKRRIEGAATDLETRLIQMRSEALKQNHRTFVSFTGSGENWRYGLDDEAACDTTIADDCAVDEVERVFEGSEWKGVSLTQDFAGNSVGFEPRRGMALGAGTITLTSVAGEVRVRVSPIGHVSTCSPAGAQRLYRYNVCS